MQALYDYTPNEEGELEFQADDDILFLRNSMDDGWLIGAFTFGTLTLLMHSRHEQANQTDWCLP